MRFNYEYLALLLKTERRRDISFHLCSYLSVIRLRKVESCLILLFLYFMAQTLKKLIFWWSHQIIVHNWIVESIKEERRRDQPTLSRWRVTTNLSVITETRPFFWRLLHIIRVLSKLWLDLCLQLILLWIALTQLLLGQVIPISYSPTNKCPHCPTLVRWNITLEGNIISVHDARKRYLKFSIPSSIITENQLSQQQNPTDISGLNQ